MPVQVILILLFSQFHYEGVRDGHVSRYPPPT